MLLDNAAVESNFKKFVKRIIESETVYYLSNENGVANSVSNDIEETVILMFWSDRAYTTRANHSFKENYNETEMELFNFLYQWLPGMSGDKVLTGPNWTGEFIGKEIDPFELREIIEDQLPLKFLNKYETKYDELTKNA